MGRVHCFTPPPGAFSGDCKINSVADFTLPDNPDPCRRLNRSYQVIDNNNGRARSRKKQSPKFFSRRRISSPYLRERDQTSREEICDPDLNKIKSETKVPHINMGAKIEINEFFSAGALLDFDVFIPGIR